MLTYVHVCEQRNLHASNYTPSKPLPSVRLIPLISLGIVITWNPQVHEVSKFPINLQTPPQASGTWVARLLAATVWINCFSKRGLPPCPFFRESELWQLWPSWWKTWLRQTLGISAGLAYLSRLQDEVQWTTHLTHPQQDATLSRLFASQNMGGFRWFPSCNHDLERVGSTCSTPMESSMWTQTWSSSQVRMVRSLRAKGIFLSQGPAGLSCEVEEPISLKMRSTDLPFPTVVFVWLWVIWPCSLGELQWYIVYFLVVQQYVHPLSHDDV